MCHHICISMSKEELEGLIERLEKNGTPACFFMENFFGARGFAPRTFYFYDLDGNVFEARYAPKPIQPKAKFSYLATKSKERRNSRWASRWQLSQSITPFFCQPTQGTWVW